MQPTATVINSDQAIQQNDLSRIRQFIHENDNTPTHKRLELTEDDVNQMLRYASQHARFNMGIQAQAQLHPKASELLVSINTFLPLRPFLNIRLDFTTEGKNIVLLGGKIGSLELPQQSIELLVNLTMPYAQQHAQYQPGTQLWQTIQDIQIQEDQLNIEFIVNKSLQAELQQQQLELIIGKSALERLPFYQQLIEQQFQSSLGKRVKLYRVMQQLFIESVTQQTLGADPIADNKAIILALFLHTINTNDFALLELKNSIELPAKAIEFTIERRKDLAQHLLTTATITLFANSSIADAVGMYKELEDQITSSGFSVSDLMADRAGSFLASNLLDNPDQARLLQKQLASIERESDIFAPSQPLATQLEQRLMSAPTNQQNLLDEINNDIDAHVRGVKIYQ